MKDIKELLKENSDLRVKVENQRSQLSSLLKNVEMLKELSKEKDKILDDVLDELRAKCAELNDTKSAMSCKPKDESVESIREFARIAHLFGSDVKHIEICL